MVEQPAQANLYRLGTTFTKDKPLVCLHSDKPAGALMLLAVAGR
jgi:hypothetical protein